jgi:hypothetical protein
MNWSYSEVRHSSVFYGEKLLIVCIESLAACEGFWHCLLRRFIG